MKDNQKTYLIQNYKRQEFSPSKGRGCWLYDKENNRYMDGLSGIAVNTLGHNHKKLVKAISIQARNLLHVSNLYKIQTQEQLARRLASLTGLDKSFYCNSGLEANEAALKLARKFGIAKGIKKPKIIVFENAFHGRSFATMSASSGKKSRSMFGDTISGFVRVPINDIDAILALEKNYCNIVAVMLEPIQGEGGINISKNNFLKRVRKLCTSNKWLLIFDEVQCGIGRTGNWFAFQKAGIKPDILTLAKGLGSGVPIGALLVKEQYADILGPGDHGSTFGGNPLAMQAGLTTLDVVEEEKLLENARNRGDQILKRLKSELKNYPHIVSIRGIGLMIGIQLKVDCSQITKIALDNGLLVNVTNSNVIRLLPPLIISQREVEILLSKLILSIKTFFEK
ncbi:aspartate aminotransferase family protein [Betaproteobacteria bacterium]|nr:aspartate aminotransferase family protein [Betaproteobacteria bacterium]